MDEELQNRLYEKYPVIFGDKDLPMSQTAMCWGFQCDNGWYNLLDNLCSNLDSIHRELGIQTIATTVKEKLAGLRFYYRYDLDEGRDPKDEDKEVYLLIESLVSEFEKLSETTCEICGEQGHICEKGKWYKTLCHVHAEMEGYQRSVESEEI